jgi:4,5-DOPA dioxygenase extradiol
MENRMPVLFLGHGNPMNALARNRYSEAWARLGVEIPRPSAILCVSAHWYVPGVAVTVDPEPRTIHDFGGFPPELYQVQYPAPGDPDLANRVRQLLSPLAVEPSRDWGLDHGAWSVLTHLYPHADVPVVQLSIDQRQPARFHYEIGLRLAQLRDENVLILGSGNLVHNLRAYAWGSPAAEPYAWALRFEQRARQCLAAGEHDALVDYPNLDPDALLSVPTPDHYLPLLYACGASLPGDPVAFPVEGIEGGSISMLAVRLG